MNETKDLRGQVEQLQKECVKKEDIQAAVDVAIAAKASPSWPQRVATAKDGQNEWKAKVKGFPKGTMSDEIEAGAKMVAAAAGAAGIVKMYSPGWRADKAFITFKSEDGLKSFLRSTRGKEYPFKVDETEVKLTAVPHRSQADWESSKESRLLVKTIAEISQMERTDTSWKTLYGDHKNKTVYLGRDIVGEMEKDDSQPDKTWFKIHVDRIDAQAKKMGIEISGEAVKEEFNKKMAQ
jgi:hypothetical protein